MDELICTAPVDMMMNSNQHKLTVDALESLNIGFF